MQNRGAVWLFTILLAIACLYQLSFTFVASSFESEAAEIGKSKADSVKRVNPGISSVEYDRLLDSFTEKYLKDNSQREIYPVFGFNYADCKKNELSLGLDLQGGMSVTLEVSIPEMVGALAANEKDQAFVKAMSLARSRQSESQVDFITEFERAYQEVAPNGKLAAIFHSRDNATKFPATASNSEIINTLREEAKVAIDNVERILRNRIDKFGVVQPTIQKQQYSGRILIDLPGVKDKERVRKVLQSTATLEFWDTYTNEFIYPKLEAADKAVSEILYPGVRAAFEAKNKTKDTASDSTKTNADSTQVDTASSDVESLLAGTDSAKTNKPAANEKEDPAKVSPVFAFLRPAVYQDERQQLQLIPGAIVGFAAVSDTDQVNNILNNDVFKANMPTDLRLLWASKPDKNTIALYAIKSTRDGKAPLDGGSIVDARRDFNQRNEVEVTMRMNSEGAKIWADMTTAASKNRDAIAIVLDNYVQSAPSVNGPIPNGSSAITMGAGNKADQLNEADDLANILKAGALPAPASIVDEAVVGPSLGADNIQAGMNSFFVALGVIILYIWFYYNIAGLVANLALLASLFFIMGSLASWHASLTLPGIAGIILTIGISVDANVLIYERVREELRLGKSLKEALDLGYKRASSAIIDGNLTTLLTAIVLTAFGTGPIRGFAVTLIFGILCSLFSAIFITRLIFTAPRFANYQFRFSSKATANLFTNVNFDWVGKRRVFYIISSLVITAGVISMFTRGFSLGIDFTGGRTYTVQFDDIIEQDKIRQALATPFESAPEVKTIGSGNSVKITTNYLIQENAAQTDAKVEAKLQEGLNTLGSKYKIMESRKVDGSISDDIVKSAVISVTFSLLIIFLYIVLRFRRWQFGLGALASLFHDILLILSVFAIGHGYLPFSMEIDQHFIAALLTILGYSINDTVVVFDRIREYLKGKDSKADHVQLINNALNSTLGRTLNTSFTTFVVMLMIFLFGGDSIKGFVFALLLGIAIGTYSSLCVATPIVVDFGKKGDFTK
ncbi:MAG TPA: protein translocase subunit SecDF [Luteibaculaceae bacterium]|nr:protein translocase subunit SecDF [Luteibaculaceae bacterium]